VGIHDGDPLVEAIDPRRPLEWAVLAGAEDPL